MGHPRFLGDSMDIEPWLKAAVTCEWNSGQRALMVPFDDDEDKAVVYDTIKNLVVNKLGFVLTYSPWSHRPLPAPASGQQRAARDGTR